MPLPIALYTTAQVRALDRYAIESLGIPGYSLMKRAGEAALRYMRARWPTAYRIGIVCGGGNNGGDGYVLARFAQAAGLTVTAYAAVPIERLRGDARQAHDDFKASEGRIEPFTAEKLSDCEVVVDALLGTGLTTDVRAESAEVIRAINASGKPVFALDVPSGLDADTGLPRGIAVCADSTVTFVGAKTGLLLGDGPDFTGTAVFDDLGISPPPLPQFDPPLTRVIDAEITMALPRRSRAAHKGDFGRLVLAGGGMGMPGAPRLAGEAALRVGAGIVTVATYPQNVAAISAGCPELICMPVETDSALPEVFGRADMVAIGPGLGQSVWSHAVFRAFLECAKPAVLDADALNLLAATQPPSAHRQWILTPHPGEAARLLGVTTDKIQQDRLAALQALVERYRCIVVLKGAGTLIGGPGRTPGICERGNPGMASAGMGDVLTGVIAGIYAQCRDLWMAARAGVQAHALAGDIAARAGKRGLLASDVIRELRACVNS
jgi:NAD(P)H-hydrate epimerase